MRRQTYEAMGAAARALRTIGEHNRKLNDPRARLVTHFKDGNFLHPAALFRLAPDEQTATESRDTTSGNGGTSHDDDGSEEAEAAGDDLDDAA